MKQPIKVSKHTTYRPATRRVEFGDYPRVECHLYKAAPKWVAERPVPVERDYVVLHDPRDKDPLAKDVAYVVARAYALALASDVDQDLEGDPASSSRGDRGSGDDRRRPVLWRKGDGLMYYNPLTKEQRDERRGIFEYDVNDFAVANYGDRDEVEHVGDLPALCPARMVDKR